MLLLGICCGALVLAVIVLLVKIRLLHKAADEITAQFAAKLEDETNTVITISGGDRHMRRLATGINTQLRLLNRERHRFQQGDLEVRGAMTNISHDLRTPLTAILGYLDLLEKQEKSEAVARYLSHIQNRTEALRLLTEELFEYSVFTTQPEQAATEPVNLNSALEESIADFYDAFKGTGITPKIAMPEEAVTRSLDKASLMRVFANVLDNALKYSSGDLGVSLFPSGEIVFSNMAADLDEVQVGKLFNRFYTVGSAKHSTGLGLAISRALVERMNGTIDARYTDGRLSILIMF